MKTYVSAVVGIIVFFLFFFTINRNPEPQEYSPDITGPGVCVDPGPPIQIPYSNIQVSNDPNCYYQSETSIAINPLNPSNIVAAWVDYRNGRSRIGYGYTFNGGQNWQNGIIQIPVGLNVFYRDTDPSISVDKNGNFFIAFISISGLTYGGIYVAKSTDGGVTWPDALFKRLDTDVTFDDKPFLIIDRTNKSTQNNIYVFWNHDNAINWFSRSTDGGSSFSPPSPPVTGGYGFGVNAAIDLNGNLFAVWPYPGGGDRIIYFTKSTDGGSSFVGATRIDTVTNFGPHLKYLDRILVFPYLATNPVSGDLYLTYNKQVSGSGLDPIDSSDVIFRRSTDGGLTWSPKINIITNSIDPSVTKNDQFFPSITVNPNGNRISIMFFDRSDFVNNDSSYVKVSTSIDGGLSFTPPVLISNHASIPEANNSFFGDYNCITPSPDAQFPGTVFAIWADTRNGNTDVFMSPADIEIRLKGTISNNSTLSGKVYIEDNVTIPAGVTLTIVPGTAVKVGNGYGLTINGKLIANGTPTQRITFTSSNPSPMSGDWQGITCSGGGPDTLTYCDIKYAYDGLQLMNTAANSYMQNDSITHTEHCGLFVFNTGTANTSLKMYKCGVSYNDGRAVQVSNAKVLVSYTRIESNDLQTIGASNFYVSNGGKVYMDSTRIQNNIGSGIDVGGLNSRVSLSIDEVQPGYNTIYRNGVGEIYVHNSATALLGYTASISYCDCIGAKMQPSPSSIGCPPGCVLSYRYEPRAGWNNVYDTWNYTGRLINNATTTTVKARYTYWGTHQPNEFIGPVDASNELGSPITTPAKMNSSSPGIGTFAIESVITQQNMLEWLRQLANDIITNKENAVDALYQLAFHVGPGGEYQVALPQPWETFLIAVEASNLPNKLKSIASVLRLEAKLNQSQFTEAIGLSDQILSRSGISNDMWMYCQTRKIFASVGRGDNDGGWSIFNTMKSRGLTIDSNAVNAMEHYLTVVAGKNNGRFGAGGGLVKGADDRNTGTPQSFVLEQNYPNPFNPTTRFDYALPSSEHVTLRIYDVLGREIATLINEVQDAGYKSVSFNANNLPSGIYFYRLSAGKFTDVKKFILLK